MNYFCIITITISLKSSDFFKTLKTVINQKNKNFFYIIVASKAGNYDAQKVEKILNDNNIKYKIIELEKSDFFIIDDHPNKKGHSKIANILYDLIKN